MDLVIGLILSPGMSSRVRAKLFASYVLVALAAFVAATTLSETLWPALIIAVVIALMAAYYASGSTADMLSRLAATIGELGDENSPPREPDDPDSLEPVATALTEADNRFRQVIAQLTTDKETRDLILNNMRDGVLLLDSKAEIILANPAIGRIFRLDVGDLVGRTLVHAIPSQELDDLVASVIAKEAEAEADFDTFMPRERHLEAVGLPIRDELGMSGVLLVIHDTTGKQRIEAVRRDFVANVSHELKTPVSGITLLADTIITGLETDPSQAKAFARKLKRETDRLAQLVRDLLDLSQLEAEKMRPVSTQISLSDVALKAVTEQTEAAASAGISLRTEFATDLPKITGSEEQLELLVRNLIDNGVKYTPKGGDILLSTKTTGGFVALIIKDTGIGIPQSDQKRIFERFYRVDKNRSRETGGTGLGLSIVKHVVENHNGQVKVESTVGLGSKFTILLPTT